MKYLFDTNILSELKKPKPKKKVVEFVKNLANENIFISSISIGEIKSGIASCKDKNKAKDLNLWFEKYLISELKDQTINIGVEIMSEWGELTAKTKNLPILDSLIAATCLAHKLCLVTRNVKDFERVVGLKIINPWN